MQQISQSLQMQINPKLNPTVFYLTLFNYFVFLLSFTTNRLFSFTRPTHTFTRAQKLTITLPPNTHTHTKPLPSPLQAHTPNLPGEGPPVTVPPFRGERRGGGGGGSEGGREALHSVTCRNTGGKRNSLCWCS